MNARTERLEAAGPAGCLQVQRDQPDGASQGVAIIAHPHPLH
ncbi:MAG: alpha/beta hydrolase, partial [Comamonadaceae bacterium]